MSLSRKTIAGALAAVALGAAVVSASTPASAQWRGYRGGYGWGGPVAAGVLGGLALGAIAGANRPYYYPPAAYYGPPAYYPYPACHVENRPIFDRWGRFIGYRPYRDCY